jgi:antitoxin component YwqK of YwqJK toxin-antitoxin module
MSKKFTLALFVFLLGSLFSESLFGQKVIKDTIGGREVYVYPFRVQVSYNNAYFMGLRHMRPNHIAVKEWYKAYFGDNYSKEGYREYMSQMKRRNIKREVRTTKYMRKRKMRKAIRSNPYPLIQSKYSMDKDIVPLLDKVPDGLYVQYFDTIVLIQQDGRSIRIPNKVAGYFNLKDNMLEGEAVWFNPAGDTAKAGFFHKGLKVGDWRFTVIKAENRMNERSAKEFVAKGVPMMDTIHETFQFKNGLKEGAYSYSMNSKYPIMQGYFHDNKASGEWIHREIRYEGLGSKRRRIRNNDVITLRYTLAASDTVVKRPIIRYMLFSERYRYGEENPFDFDAKYEPSINLNKFYALAYPVEAELDMEEERIGSYEGSEDDISEEIMEEEYLEEEEEYFRNESGGNTYGRKKYDYNTGEQIPYARLIDSLGIKFAYRGIYEKYYPNGKLMVRYDFGDGQLESEDTIYWDNGKPYDVIVFNQDSSHFEQSVYDYTGTLYKRLIFDSIGVFKRVDFEPQKMKFITVDGFQVSDNPDEKYFFYDKVDTLEYDLKDSLILFRSWYKMDTSVLYSRSYVPEDRKLQFNFVSVKGTHPLNTEIIFGEDFQSWTGSTVYKAGDLRVETKTSASFLEYYEPDSIPQLHVNQYDEYFEMTQDQMLFRKDMPFSGKIDIRFNTSSFGLKSSSGKISVDLPRSYSQTAKLDRDIRRFRKKGKCRNDLLLGLIDASETDEDFGASIFSNLIGGFVQPYVEYPYNDFHFEMEGPSRLGRRNGGAGADKVEGAFVGGKPQGLWKVKDADGKVIAEIPYLNGEIHGVVKQYDYAQPRPRGYGRNYDTVPNKKTFYLASETEYKNGIQQGKYTVYNWVGQILLEENYVDGAKHGKAFERNSFAHTDLSYEFGALDGYIRTYLTLPKKDSLLLFELNFQDGLLQGESRSYHTNGKLAKRGFFLNGEPIDDYEAFDSLGVKYHYVKFQYSFPVEEKIWEENELSVRYLFDWRDSIAFRPTDITSTQSLDRMLYQMGIGTEALQRPYYGRPSLIEKRGITYHMTKYYPNDTVARDGSLSFGKKTGCWKYYNYDGEMLYEVDYFDTVITIQDSIKFKSKGVLTDFNSKGQKLSESYIIEKFEKYDCSHTDHYEIRQLMTIWQAHDSLGLFNGYVKNYYDNGVLMNEGKMQNGMPVGVWKFYDPYGKLNQVGEYVLGKRNGRWLAGDLSKTKYLGDICLNPNLPNLEEEIRYREKLLDIVITNYRMGKALNKEFYDVNLNNFDDENSEGSEEVIEEVEMEEGE